MELLRNVLGVKLVQVVVFLGACAEGQAADDTLRITSARPLSAGYLAEKGAERGPVTEQLILSAWQP